MFLANVKNVLTVLNSHPTEENVSLQLAWKMKFLEWMGNVRHVLNLGSQMKPKQHV